MHLWLVKRQITIFTNDDIRDKGQVKLARKLISIEPRSFLLLAGWLLIVTWKQLKNWPASSVN